MNLAELQDYSKWVGKTAEDVLQSVINCGGWINVFPTSLPKWASRIRNYFNILPTSFQRVEEPEAGTLVQKHHKFRSGLARRALSGDVYRDEEHRIWFEMHRAGSVYHYPGKVNWLKKGVGFLTPQAFTPVFKLISPDGAGGSLEVILDNPKTGWFGRSSSISKPGQVVHLKPLLVLTEEYQATYNYSETISMGFDAHDLRDIKPHDPARGFYINPPLPSSALATRLFPANDPLGKVLATQN
jgi:hypothetical protein